MTSMRRGLEPCCPCGLAVRRAKRQRGQTCPSVPKRRGLQVMRSRLFRRLIVVVFALAAPRRAFVSCCGLLHLFHTLPNPSPLRARLLLPLAPRLFRFAAQQTPFAPHVAHLAPQLLLVAPHLLHTASLKPSVSPSFIRRVRISTALARPSRHHLCRRCCCCCCCHCRRSPPPL